MAHTALTNCQTPCRYCRRSSEKVKMFEDLMLHIILSETGPAQLEFHLMNWNCHKNVSKFLRILPLTSVVMHLTHHKIAKIGWHRTQAPCRADYSLIVLINENRIKYTTHEMKALADETCIRIANTNVRTWSFLESIQSYPSFVALPFAVSVCHKEQYTLLLM